MAYSRWARIFGFIGWVTHSEICLAKADSLFGTFRFVKVIHGHREGNAWDRDVAHNPCTMVENGKVYLYYMGNYGNGETWNHRNHQRIGAAWADDPEGEWHFFDTPAMDVTPQGLGSLMVSNPSVTKTPAGRYYLLYHRVDDNGTTKGGSVICEAAFATAPLGPFIRCEKPIFVNPTNPWSVEDPFVWWEDGQYHAILSDYHGYFTGVGSRSLALFCSKDGIDWAPASEPLFSRLEYPTADGMRQVYRMERPQLVMDSGKKLAAVFACWEDSSDYRRIYNIRIPLKPVP